MTARRIEPPSECAVCGADLPRNAKACPECGADERTGWREQSIYDGLDLPGDRDEIGTLSQKSRGGLRWYWLLAGVLTLGALVFAVLGLA